MNKSLNEFEQFKRLPEFDWDKAKAFYYVAKIGSQVEAARILGISQPSLSRQISILEEELQCKLMNRSPFGVILTRKGKEFLKNVEQFYLSMQRFCYNHIVLDSSGEKRKFKISTTHPMASYFLKVPLLEYNMSHPEIAFSIITDNHETDLVVNDIDVAIRPYDPKAKGVIQEPLFHFKKRLFASQAYLEKYGTPETVEDLQYHQVMAHAQPEKHGFAYLDWILTVGMPNGEKRESALSSTSLETLVEAAQKGLGIMGGYQEMSIMRESGLQMILMDIESPIIEGYLVYRDYLAEDKQFIDFRDFLVTELSRFETSVSTNSHRSNRPSA